MRSALFALLACLVLAASGCTSSDRDFVRNHIVLRSKSPNLDHRLGGVSPQLDSPSKQLSGPI